MRRFSDAALRELKKAGWFPGRNMHELAQKWIRQISECGEFELFNHVGKIFTEFGGLFFNVTGKGIHRYKEPFIISPDFASVEDLSLEDFIEEMPEEAGLTVYPIGKFTENECFIVTDAKERILFINGDFVHFANNFDEAIENFLTRRESIHKLSLSQRIMQKNMRIPSKKGKGRVPFSDW
ncbi:MAG: hypothetical protein GY757_31935 [bacterium]|nr:hypothetical protein [bacterium]